MRNFTFTLFLFLIFYFPVNAQVITSSDFADLPTLSKSKFESFIVKKGFTSDGTDMIKDTVIANYIFVNTNNKGAVDSNDRFLSWYLLKKDFQVTYKTTSLQEADKLKSGIFSNRQFRKIEWTLNPDSSFFLQKENVTILISKKKEHKKDVYCFTIAQKVLPEMKDIRYAEDLLVFDSHENLQFVFGKENVKKDIYYFSEKQVSKCSVLFPNTNRQVIFLWGDELNNYKLASILIGGTLRVQSAINFNEHLSPNVWTLRNGIHSGMSLQELQMLNGGSFKFYGFNSSYSGIVVPQNSGNIDFKKSGVILTCLNCNDASFLKQNIVDANDAIGDNRKLYVFTIFLLPETQMALNN